MNLEIKILDPRLGDLGLLPDYATEGAAAVDLRACTIGGWQFERFTVAPGSREKIGTGIAVDLGSLNVAFPVAGLILPRSGLGARGVTLGNAPGLLDADYQGEITLALWNSGPHELVINAFDRLAQLLIVPVMRPVFVPVPEFSRVTERGEGGFGSTGSA